MNKNPPLSFLQIETAANSGAFGHNSLPIPSQAQTLAGNYKLGKTNIYGLPIAIENPRNSYRTGVDSKTGKRWSNRMAAHYGYIQGTKGADGDAIDCFIGVFPQSEHAYVINQYVNGAFDEHKVMLCVPDEATAKSNYLDSYDKGWNGLHSMVKASITQLKWWLKNGNHAKPLQPSHLPHEGIETMNQQSVVWDSASNPTNTSFAKLIYDIRLADKDDLLILDSASMGDILADADEVMVLDAMVSSFGKLPRKMEMLKTVMESAGGEVKPLNVQISEPFKQNGVMQVAAVFELSDGQTISVFFHNPDVTPGKVTASDEMVSWKWLLNKKDITIVVAPEQGKDLNVRAVASRIIKLAEKNSAAFQRANAKRAENMAAIDAIKTEITDLEKQLTAKQNELEVAKVEAEDKLVADQKSQEAFKQSVLQALIDDFGWENQSTTGGNLFWVTKTIGGGREGGVINPNGDRRLSAKIQGKELVATHGDNALVTVPFNTDETAVENAKRLDDAVNAIDPRYVAAVDDLNYEQYLDLSPEAIRAMTDDEYQAAYSLLESENLHIDNYAMASARKGDDTLYQAFKTLEADNIPSIRDNEAANQEWSDRYNRLRDEFYGNTKKAGNSTAKLPQGENPPKPYLTEDERYDREDMLAVNEKDLLKFVKYHRFENELQSFDEWLGDSKYPNLDDYALREFAETAYLVEKEVESYGGTVSFGNFDYTAYNTGIFDRSTTETKVIAGSIIGQIADKSGSIVARFRVDENGMLTVYSGASGVEKVADPTMEISRINSTIATVFGGEQNKLKEPNLGADARVGSTAVGQDSNPDGLTDAEMVVLIASSGYKSFARLQNAHNETKTKRFSDVDDGISEDQYNIARDSLNAKGKFLKRSSVTPEGFELVKNFHPDLLGADKKLALFAGKFANQSDAGTADQQDAEIDPNDLVAVSRKVANMSDVNLKALRKYSEGSEDDMKSPLKVTFTLDKISDVFMYRLKQMASIQDKYNMLKNISKDLGVKMQIGSGGRFQDNVDLNKAIKDGKEFGYVDVSMRKGYTLVTMAIDLNGKNKPNTENSKGQSQPNTQDTSSTHIDTLQSIIDGQHDSDDLNTLLDTIEKAAAALSDAGLGEQYDEMIGKAAEKWAELDQKANG